MNMSANIPPAPIVFDPALKRQFNLKAKALNILPIKVTPHYNQLIQEEYEALRFQGGPLYRVVYPTKERLDIRVNYEVPDFVEDQTNMPEDLSNVLIHKYSQRALFLVTDRCVSHCMYCFRQDVLTDIHGNPLPPIEERVERVVQYLSKHPEVTELILSGGDPLNIPFHRLEYLFKQLSEKTAVQHIRVHTRNLVFAPHVVTQEVAELLSKYHARLYIHVVHPYEIEEKMTAVVRQLQRAGVRTYSQFPILRGINDHVKVLEQLLLKLDVLRASPINLFIPDPINYSATFRVPMKRLLRLMDELYWSTGSWCSGARLVLDTPIGKVRREDIAAWDEAKGEIIFRREGKDVIYHDFPAELDEAGELETLLWKG